MLSASVELIFTTFFTVITRYKKQIRFTVGKMRNKNHFLLFCLQDRFTSVSPATEIVVMTSRLNAKRRHYFEILTHSGEYFRFEFRNEIFEHRTMEK